MTNIIHSQSMNNNNNTALRNNLYSTSFSKGSQGFVEAPEYYPRYSLGKELNKKDEFRKEIRQTNYLNNMKVQKRKSFLSKMAIVLSIAASYLYFRNKV